MDQKGLTLIELLIVMVLIGVLATFSTYTYLRSQRRARDTIRKNDLAQIKKALELAKQDGNLRGAYYPTASTNPSWPGFDAAWSPYMTRIPKDPKSSGFFVYNYAVFQDDGPDPDTDWDACSSNCTRFRLQAALEDTSDPQVTTPAGKCGSSVAVDAYIICSD